MENTEPTANVHEDVVPLTSASLYIGDLADDVTEPILYEIFSQPASVASIRICRDSMTQNSLGYGYVNYHTVGDAERAMDVLNFTLIKGKPCRIMWKNPDKTSRQNSQNNVFVKNLDKNIDNKALYDTFSLFGTIVSCKVATDSKGKSLGYGYVQYEKERSLKDAIERVHGMQIGGNQVYCARHLPKDSRRSLRDEKFNNLYIKGYPTNYTEEQMRTIFSEFGEITSIALTVDQKERPFGFVNYKELGCANKAIDALHGLRFAADGKMLSKAESDKMDVDNPDDDQVEEELAHLRFYVQRHESKAEREAKLKSQFQQTIKPAEDKPVVLYTRHFPLHYGEDQLRELFEPHGLVSSVKVATDEAGHPKGFAFICFNDPADAQKALTALHDSSIDSTSASKLYVTYLEPKEVRSHRLKAALAENLWLPQQYSPGYPSKPAGRKSPTAVRAPAPRNPVPRPGLARPVQRRTDAQSFADSIKPLNFKEKKQAIGDRLYHHIMSKQPVLAGKITGMMLEMENSDLLTLLSNSEELESKINEAMEVLKAAGGTDGAEAAKAAAIALAAGGAAPPTPTPTAPVTTQQQ